MHKTWSSMKEVPYNFFKIVRQMSKSRGTKKSSIFTWTECFRTVTPVGIHWCIGNKAQSLMYYRRGALLLCEVIHQISSSHRLKYWQFESNLSKITRPVAAIKSLRFALFSCWFALNIICIVFLELTWCFSCNRNLWLFSVQLERNAGASGNGKKENSAISTGNRRFSSFHRHVSRISSHQLQECLLSLILVETKVKIHDTNCLL